jgi:cyclic pyranopterin phosphate synthase
MPRTIFGADYPFLPRSELLTFEEIARVVRAAATLGVNKIRLSGGEPLLRRDLDVLVTQITQVAGIEDIALTTNGTLLAAKADSLVRAGLNRVTVSLDALDDGVFRRMNDVDAPVQRVLDAIDAASQAGLHPIKVNMVVKRSVNLDQIIPMAGYFRNSGHILRFIEFMDVGTTNGWDRRDVVPRQEILDIIGANWPIESMDSPTVQVAENFQYLDGAGEIGVISSISQPFCRTCVRARLSAKGELFTCLFAAKGFDLAKVVRTSDDDDLLRDTLEAVWLKRGDRYSEIRSQFRQRSRKVEMSYIGG